MNGVESVGYVILIEEVENDDLESFVGGKPEKRPLCVEKPQQRPQYAFFSLPNMLLSTRMSHSHDVVICGCEV